MEKKKEFELTELWLVKADWERTFIGTIRREKGENGTPRLIGNADINGVAIFAEATSEEDLTDKLDELCTKILDGEGL